MFRFLKCCCDIICPPCPYPNGSKRGWTTRPISGCPQCPDCPPCPYPYGNRTGYSGSFLNNCPRCPTCEDDPCYIVNAPGFVCPCLAQRYFVVLAGLDANCACFLVSTGGEPGEHIEMSGNDFNGGYCFTPSGSVSRPYNFTMWDAVGDGFHCGPPNGIVDTGDHVDISFTNNSFGPTQRELIFDITGYGLSEVVQIFHARLLTADCRGPWVLPNEINECGYPPIKAGRDGVAIVYPCQC